VRRVRCSIEIDARVNEVFAQWTRFESLPRLMDGVRHAKRIDERHILWDADVSGHQVVWEAEILEVVPCKRIRWRSRWGAVNSGEVGFEELGDRRTLLTVDLSYRPRGLIEQLGAHLRLVGPRIVRDLAQFRRCVESRARREARN
jgi:uncharacterized membrane protein